MEGISSGLEALFRWMHIFAGILWIGHLYFFNFVNGPFEGKLDGGTKKIVVPEHGHGSQAFCSWGLFTT